MKIQAEDAVTSAMDWLAQLREEEGSEPRRDAGGEPAAGAAPPAPVPPVPVPRAAVPPVPVPRAAVPPVPVPRAAAPRAAEPLASAPPPPEPLTAKPVAPLPPVPVPRAAEPVAPLPPVPVLRAAEPLAPLPPVPVPSAADPPYPVRAAEPLAAQPHVPVPGAADVRPVTAWATTAWATAATAAAAPPADMPSGGPSRRARMRTSGEITERAAIGDELRIPIAWCEMGSCISHHEDPMALGEADIRDRAVAAGWRVDALGRLACPRCLQSDSWFWTAHPVAPWDRDTAVARTTLMAAVAREYATAAGAAEREMGVSPYTQPAIGPLPIRRRHGEHPGRPGRGTGEGSRGSNHAV